MELDDLKSAWQILDRRLEQQSALNLHLFRQSNLERMRSTLRPLFWGQLLQMAFGVAFIAFAAVLWSTRPDAVAVIVAGVVVHAYGVTCIILAGVTLGQIQRIDFSAAVLDIQKQLARLRTSYIVSGMVAGMPWWFLWVPILMVLLGMGGVNLYARAPEVVWIGLGVGAAGLIATYALQRWSRAPSRPRLAKFVDDSVTGSSLRRARQVLDEIAKFEKI